MSISFKLLVPVFLASLAACGLSTATAGADAASASSQQRISAAPDSLVGLRYAALEAGGWAGVVEAENRYFEQNVSIVYRAADGSWPSQAAQPLRMTPSGTELFFFSGLPALEPLLLAAHDQAIFSGGTGLDLWDNNGGANYQASRDSSPLGPGVDIAVTALSVSQSTASVELLVRDLAYEKDVEVVYSTDSWATVETATAAYDHGSGGGEVWRATATLDPSVTTLALAAVARQAGRESWDNNFNANFGCHAVLESGWECSGAELLDCSTGTCQPTGAQ